MNSVNTPALMTQAEFAAHRGVGRSAVSNWKKRNLVVFAEGEDGSLKVDVARTEARLNAKVDPTRGRPTTGQPAAAEPADRVAAPAGGGVAEVRSDLLRQQVIAATMKNAQAAGTLVPIEEYERRSSELGRMARERTQAMLRGLAERFAAVTDAREIRAIGSAEIDRVFEELADHVAGGALGDDVDAGELEELTAESVTEAVVEPDQGDLLEDAV